MKRLSFIVPLSLAAGSILSVQRPSPALALAGCCKVRDSQSAPWRTNGATFEVCEQQNRERDRDNVYDERGLVWWDSRCN